MLMSPDTGQTAVYSCHSPGYVFVRLCLVQARPWVGVRVSNAIMFVLGQARQPFVPS